MLPRIHITLGDWKLFLWAGNWSIYDRNGWTEALWSTKPCPCHRFALYIGPFGIERQ